MTRAIAVAWAVFFGAAHLGCAGWGGASGCDLRSADWSGLFAEAPLRAHVRLISGDSDQQLEMVVRKRAGELVLVGLTHYGMKLFVVRQEGSNIRIEGALSGEHERMAGQAADALRRAFEGPSTAPSVGGMPRAIRYASSNRNPGSDIRESECGYRASVARVSDNNPSGAPVSTEGVEP